MTLVGQKVVVFGGSSGIGLATAQVAAGAGAEVFITGRDVSKLNEAARQVGLGVHPEVVDAADVAAVRSFFARLGRFDHLVLAVSGAKGAGPFETLSLDELRGGFEAKFWLHVAAAQSALPTLDQRGSITFISAISARTGNPGTAGLAAINAAIEALVPPLAVELKPRRVNAVSPGLIDTPWWGRVSEEQRQALFDRTAKSTPVGRVGRPEDVARAILFLLEDDFMTGTVLECDGGLRLAR